VEIDWDAELLRLLEYRPEELIVEVAPAAMAMDEGALETEFANGTL
jgi:hypothetical protein